jgi:hypothetical protein
MPQAILSDILLTFSSSELKKNEKLNARSKK